MIWTDAKIGLGIKVVKSGRVICIQHYAARLVIVILEWNKLSRSCNNYARRGISGVLVGEKKKNNERKWTLESVYITKEFKLLISVSRVRSLRG